MTHGATAAPLDAGRLEAMASRASESAEVARWSVFAFLTFGLLDADTGEAFWIRVENGKVTAGAGQADTRFTLSGGSAAWSELVAGMPVNRLLRQGKVSILGDARSCMQNWLLVYTVLSLAGREED